MRTPEENISIRDKRLRRAEEYYQECLSIAQKNYEEKIKNIEDKRKLMIGSANKDYELSTTKLKTHKQIKTKSIDLSKLSQTELWSEFNKQGIESIGLSRDTKYTSLTPEQKIHVNHKREELLLQHKRKTDADWIAAAAEWEYDPMTTNKEELELIQSSYDTILYNREYEKYNPEEKEEPVIELNTVIPITPLTQSILTEEKIVSIIKEQVTRAVTPLREKVNDTKSHLFHQPSVTKEVIDIPPPPKFKKPLNKLKARPAEGLAGSQKYSIPVSSLDDENE